MYHSILEEFEAYGYPSAFMKLIFEKGDQRVQKARAKWGSNVMAVRGRMGTNLQLVNAIYTCSEG